MLTSTAKRRLLPKVYSFSRYFTSTVQHDEYTSVPNYPPILDLSPRKKRERRKIAEHEQIKAVKTVEEKQIKINMPRYYGFKCYLLTEDRVPFDSLPLIQHVTKTHLIESSDLPEFYNNLEADNLLNSVKSDIEETILYEFAGLQRKHTFSENPLTAKEIEEIISSSVSKAINRLLINNTVKDFPYLKRVQVDYDPRIECFWYAGGMNPPEQIKRYHRGMEWMKDEIDTPVDRGMQYTGFPLLTVRSELPLKPIISISESENEDYHVPYFRYDPRVKDVFCNHQHGTNIPGFWPGDPQKFGLLSYHQRSHMLSRNYGDPQESKEALHRQGILATHCWLQTQANFLGFTTFNEITYPLVCQAVITNGRLWSFYVYQLNTMLMHSENPKNNPRNNICWATEELKLFEEVKDGKLIGFNPDVLKTLIKFYMNVPEERLGINMQPYLSNEEKVVADYTDTDKRIWLEREYKYLMTNAPKYKLPYEIYAWEKIYKIDNKTRPMDKKLRPFELGTKPWRRTLDDRQAEYVPRALRPNVPKHWNRYKKEYFP